MLSAVERNDATSMTSPVLCSFSALFSDFAPSFVEALSDILPTSTGRASPRTAETLLLSVFVAFAIASTPSPPTSPIREFRSIPAMA